MTIGTKSRSPSAASETFPPTKTPVRKPSGEMSRLWFERRGSSSSESSSLTSPPNNSTSTDKNSDNVPEDEHFKPFDPRRFTPTLHASLVSEILNLRREVESKSKSIDILEQHLDESRTENEDLGANLSQNTKETRSLQHQLQLLEGGSSSALSELAKERDEALDNISDIRKKFDLAQKKARSREEDTERTQLLWDRERESWEAERRVLEHKVHVVENRLKVVLNEVAAAQAAGTSHGIPKRDRGDSSIGGATTGKDSDTTSVYSSSQGRRRTSMTSMSSNEGDMQNNGRFSVMSFAKGLSQDDGLSLAQELEVVEDEEFVTLDDDPMTDSPGALAEERPTSSHSQMSHTMGMKARKVLGLALEDNRGSTEGDRASETTKSPTKIPLSSSSFVYQDVGIQYSPPPSPKAAPSQAKDSSTLTLTIDMVSASCQTLGDLPSPPWTPKIDESPPLPASPPTAPVQAMVSASTQTDTLSAPEKKRTSLSPQDAIAPGMEVPTIAIYPPVSEPSSPRTSVVLPPQTKSISCQTANMPNIEGRSIAIQTEEIRIDQRPVKLPASLLPSAIPDLPLANEARSPSTNPCRVPLRRSCKDDSYDKKPFLLPPMERPSFDSKERSVGHIQSYPGINNDNGPLSKGSKPGMKRPPRTSSLFTSFDPDDDKSSEKRDLFDDDELFNRPTATYTLRRGKMVSTHRRPSVDQTTLPEIEEHLLDAKMQLEKNSVDESVDPLDRRQRSGSSTRARGIRKAAMITNGAAAHQGRGHSPSDPSTDSASITSVAPPFPVPVRHSSKFPPPSSDGQQNTTPSGRQTDRPRQPVSKPPTLRRVWSATTMSQSSDSFDQSPPGQLIDSFGTDSPRRPSLPFEDIAGSRPHPAPRRPSTFREDPLVDDPFNRERQGSAASVQHTNVVDAIAQTMVGEWMFKYIRRRSFGGGDAKDNWEGRSADEVSASITNSGVRHKRWVWLAPYERAIMWSSKQPTSGPALLGKSGRKLTIQSVLDVKDDNPLPKGSSPQSQFNRSILVLTPQRALKFTATSIERHYVWLSALSFLSHSAMENDELASVPPPIAQRETFVPSPTTAALRNPFRTLASKRSLGSRPAPVPKIPDGIGTNDTDSIGAAEPPAVPMFSKHSKHVRKRSNTTPRAPTVRNFCGFGPTPSTHLSNSYGTTIGSIDAFYPPPPTHGINSMSTSFSRRTSESTGPASTSTSTGDTAGTVRMEAFIGQPNGNLRGPRSHHRRRPSSQFSAKFSGFSGAYRPSIDTRSEASSRLDLRTDDHFRGS